MFFSINNSSSKLLLINLVISIHFTFVICLNPAIARDQKSPSGRFNVSIKDEVEKGYLEGYQKSLLKNNLSTAMCEWLKNIEGQGDILISLKIAKTTASRASGRSVSSYFIGYRGNRNLFEQSIIAKIQKGVDANGPLPDIEVIIDPSYLHLLWFDPDPLKRTARIPHGKLDGYSMLLHELGHAIAFNGWIDQKTGYPAGSAISTYDRHVIYKNGLYYFTGKNAVKLYGKPIILGKRHNNYQHVGNTRRDDKTLVRDLMNGVVLEYQYRYFISPLDLAILKDCGVKLRRK